MSICNGIKLYTAYSKHIVWLWTMIKYLV